MILADHIIWSSTPVLWLSSQRLLIAFGTLTTTGKLTYLDACLFARPKHSVLFTIRALAQLRILVLWILAEWRNEGSTVFSLHQMLNKRRLTGLLGIKGMSTSSVFPSPTLARTGSSFISLVPQVKIPRATGECFLVSQSQWLINFDHLYILRVSQSHSLTIFLGQTCKTL